MVLPMTGYISFQMTDSKISVFQCNQYHDTLFTFEVIIFLKGSLTYKMHCAIV